MVGRMSFELLGSLDAGRVLEHVRWLTFNTPRRISGTGQDAMAADYVAQQMESCGLEVKVYEFPAYNSLPGRGLLRVVDPVDRQVDCVACAHIASTPPGGIWAEFVYVGPGGEVDYQGVDVRGKVALAEISYAPATPEKGGALHFLRVLRYRVQPEGEAGGIRPGRRQGDAGERALDPPA